MQVLANGAGSVVDLSSLTSFIDSSACVTSSVQVDNGGTIQLGSGTTTVTNVDVVADTPGTITAGTLDLASGSRLFGTGTISANLTNGGAVTIGDLGGGSIGSLTVTGSYTQSAAGSLSIQIGGVNAGTQFDQLTVAGPVVLDGTLNLSLANGFNPAVGNTFQIVISSASRTGQFATVTGASIPGGKSFMVGYNAADVTLTVTSPLAAASGDREANSGATRPGSISEPLTIERLQPIVDAVIDRFVAAGLDGRRAELLRGVEFRLVDLADSYLGMTAGNIIWLDHDAAGNGWFVDTSPDDDAEFSPISNTGDLRAANAPVATAIDLLTVVAHELGHVLGLEHHSADGKSSGLMDAVLELGTRRILTDDDIDAAFATKQLTGD